MHNLYRIIPHYDHSPRASIASMKAFRSICWAIFREAERRDLALCTSCTKFRFVLSYRVEFKCLRGNDKAFGFCNCQTISESWNRLPGFPCVDETWISKDSNNQGATWLQRSDEIENLSSDPEIAISEFPILKTKTPLWPLPESLHSLDEGLPLHQILLGDLQGIGEEGLLESWQHRLCLESQNTTYI